MNANISIAARGRYKFVKYRDGEQISESPWNDNAFLYGGVAFMLHDGANAISCVVDGDSASRTSSSVSSVTTTRRTDPDENGNLWWKTEWRFTFPASPGRGIANFTRGNITVSSDVPVWVPLGGGQIPYSAATLSTSALTGTDGDDAVYTVDQDVESFEVVWEFTEYVPAEVTGVVELVTWKVGEIPARTPVSWRVLPANFDNTANPDQGWLPAEGNDFPAMRAGGVVAGAGVIGDVTTQPTIDVELPNVTANIPRTTMVPGITSHTARAVFEVHSEALVNVARFKLGHFDFQCEFTPPLDKKDWHELTILLTIAVRDGGSK